MPTIDDTRANWIKWAENAVSDNLEQYQTYEDYYEGDHGLAFATDKWEEVFGVTFEEFADNWCQVVVDAMCQRMEITGWQVEGEEKNRNSDTAKAEEIWDRNELDTDSDDLHLQTAIKGDGYMMVWPDPELTNGESEAQLFFNDALEVNVFYDPSNKKKITRAAKKFTDDSGSSHLYIYFPDHIERYVIKSSLTPDQAAAFSSPLVTGDVQAILSLGWAPDGADIKNPYDTVPVFHFKNRARGSTHGLSELKSVIPVQNAVNKLFMDLMIGSEFGSFRQKWMAGGGQPTDGWKSGSNRIWATSDPSAKFGEFGQIDLEPIFKAIEVVVSHIAKITATPMHYLRSSGDMPSGEALKTAESGLIQKCFARQRQWGAAWSRAMTFALQIETGNKPAKPVFPIWKSPETRHELEQAQTAQLKSILGVPLRVLWAEHFGYTEEEIIEFEKENKAIAAQALVDSLNQTGQLPPGSGDGVQETATSKGMELPQILAQLGKGKTSATTAGEATPNPQANTRPPASPTRRSSGFKD